VRGGRLLTPPASDGALEGITRASVLELAAELGVPAEERTLGRYDLIAADEVFLTGSGAKLVPVSSLDGARIGRGEAGPLTQKLMAAFDRFARDPENGTPLG
jgi:branched-chain amino acid aminotransferase